MHTIRVILAAILAALLLPVAVAFAADDPTRLSIPWGDWIAGAAGVVGAVIAAILARALSFAPAIVKTLLTEQLLKRSVDYALGAVAGAAKGKTLEIPVANEVIRRAAQYAVDNGAPWLLKWIGDLGPKIVARLSAEGAIPASASAATLDLAPTPSP